MSRDKDLEIFTLLQPELLATDQLINYLRPRCSNLQNLSSLSKERLVRLFRQVNLPLPQRQCWANRRGRVLAAHRLKSTPEGRQEDLSSRPAVKRLPSVGDRLKPAPDTNTPNKIRLTSSEPASKCSDLDRIVINDRRRRPDEFGNAGESIQSTVHLKRSSSSTDKHEQCSKECSTREPIKKQRRTIKWP